MRNIFKFINYIFIGFSYLASKKIIVILIFVLFIYLLDTTYAYQEELFNYDVLNMENKGMEEVKVYNKNSFIINNSSALDEKFSCYNQKVIVNDLPSSLLVKIDELNNLFKSSEEHFSFLYKDIETGFVVSYNEDAHIFTASTIKAPAMIYLYEKASLGEIDLDEKLIYDGSYYSEGSGILKDKNLNTYYTVRELIEYAIIYSDNIAYAMLMKRFKREDMYNFWTNLGTKDIFKYDTIWGYTSAKDGAIYMEELYKFYLGNDKYGSVLLDLFKNAKWKMISNKNESFNTANKGGWSDENFHDVAIVFEKNPYILAIMSKTGEGNYDNLFKKTSNLVGQIHEEYWRYKEEVCDKIKQY